MCGHMRVTGPSAGDLVSMRGLIPYGGGANCVEETGNKTANNLQTCRTFRHSIMLLNMLRFGLQSWPWQFRLVGVLQLVGLTL